MTIEIAANGDIRAAMGGTMIDEARAKVPQIAQLGYIVRAGEGYFLQPNEKGIDVLRVADAAAVLGEHLKQDEEWAKRPAPDSLQLVAGGTVTIRGRSGTAYFWGEKAEERNRPIAVISKDPALAELARAMSTMMGITMNMGGEVGFGDFSGDMAAILATGAPLAFAGMELVEVKHHAIPTERFALPSEPLSRDQVRELMTMGKKP
jgi:hypothetical protein